MINWKCNSCDGIYESLDIRFTKACDNNCSFCIEKFGIKSLGKTDVAALAKSVFDSNFKNILIVGGEPLLDLQKLYQFVHLVRSYTKVKKIYVTTSLPISIDINLDTKSLLIDIIKLIDGLNVSLQHYDSRINNVVLHASSKHDRLETLFMLTRINPEIRNKIRVNLNLVQGYIDNKVEVLKAIRLLSNVYHVKTIKLNELQNSDKYVSFENIFPDCELSSPYAHGCQTDITHYFDSLSLMHDIQILLKRSCFLVEPSKTATFSDLVKVVGKRIKNEKHKFGVLYENGKLESHWLTNEEINNKTR